MHFKLDPASPVPLYSQVADQVRYAIAAGALKPDDELPSVRALATQHLINPNTVARAYLELEHEGLVSKRRGTGTFVSPAAARLSEKKKARMVADLLDKALVHAMQLHMPNEQIREIFEERLREQQR
jgi:GntR family transcriptional regulator